MHRSVPSEESTTFHWPITPTILPPVSSRTPHLVPDTHLSSNGSAAVNSYACSNKYGSWIEENECSMPIANIEMPTITTPLSLISPISKIAKTLALTPSTENWQIDGANHNSDLSLNVGRRIPNALHLIMETTITEDVETNLQDSPLSSPTTTQLQETRPTSPAICTNATSTATTNKFTRKRERLYNSHSFINSANSINSNDFISKTDYFKAFSKWKLSNYIVLLYMRTYECTNLHTYMYMYYVQYTYIHTYILIHCWSNFITIKK